MPGQPDPRNFHRIVLPHPGHVSRLWTAQFTFEPAVHRGSLVHFIFGSIVPFSTLNTLDQTIEVVFPPPVHFHDDLLDIDLSDTNSESEEDITIVSYGPATGPSRSARAIPQHGCSSSDAIVISDGESESDADSEDIVVRLIPPSLQIFPSLPTEKTAGHGGY